jgi:hypothetical protein
MDNKIKHFVTLLAILIFSDSCETRRITCKTFQDGKNAYETVIVQRHPERQYLQTISSTNANLKVSIDVLGKIKLSGLDIGLKTKVVELRDKLNQYSSMVQDIIKGSYAALQTTPCDKDVRNNHQKLLADIIKENAALERLKSGLLLVANSSDSTGQSSTIKTLIESYNKYNGEGAFSSPKDEELNLSNSRSWGWWFDEEVNGAERLTGDGYSREKSYEPNPDTINLNKDFVIEARVRSLKKGYGIFGINFNPDLSNQSSYFLIALKGNNSKPFVYSGQSYDGESNALFVKTLDIDITQFHKLQIKKSGEIISFYLDNNKLKETNLIRIETKKLKIYADRDSDVIFDYIVYWHW